MPKFKRRRSSEPLPQDSGVSYVERYRGTEWDSGILEAKPSDPLSVSIFSGVLLGAIVFAILIALWLLFSFTS